MEIYNLNDIKIRISECKTGCQHYKFPKFFSDETLHRRKSYHWREIFKIIVQNNILMV